MIPSWTDNEIYLVEVRGHNLFLQGRYAEAVAIFEGLRVIRPGDFYCANAVAALYIHLGQIQAAIDILTEFLASHPDHVETRARRCETYAMAGRFAEAHHDAEILRRGVSGSWNGRLEVLLGAPKKIGPLKQLLGGGVR